MTTHTEHDTPDSFRLATTDPTIRNVFVAWEAQQGYQ